MAVSIGSVLFAIKVPLQLLPFFLSPRLFRSAVNRSRTVHITMEILPEGQENVSEKCVTAACHDSIRRIETISLLLPFSLSLSGQGTETTVQRQMNGISLNVSAPLPWKTLCITHPVAACKIFWHSSSILRVPSRILENERCSSSSSTSVIVILHASRSNPSTIDNWKYILVGRSFASNYHIVVKRDAVRSSSIRLDPPVNSNYHRGDDRWSVTLYLYHCLIFLDNSPRQESFSSKMFRKQSNFQDRGKRFF